MPSDPDAGTTFYVVRHAHAVWRPDERQRLSPQGRADAERIADMLAAYDVAAIYASPYPRAIETVEPLAARAGLEVRVEDGLRERKLSSGCVPDFEAAVAWAWERPDEALPGGEPNRLARARASALVEQLARRHAGRSVVLATHGSLMALLFRSLDSGFTLDDWARMTLPDVFRLSPGGGIERLWTA